jgi:2-methylcitrate dehydratase PrpD
MSDYLDRVSAFVVGAKLEDLPAATIEQARHVIADSVAAIAAGAAEPEVRALTARRIRDSGPCTVIGTGIAGMPQRAALLNGIAGTWLEMDEGNRFARGHPAIHTLPAALAYAEMHRLSGRALLLATVLGYELATRIGMAANLRPTMHPHGTWGTVGAAVAVAKLAGLDAQRMRETINIASSLTLATSKKTMLQGGTVRNVYAGISNQNGLLAVELVDCGFVGERDGLSSVFGSVVSESFDSDLMVEDLGADWQIDRNYFKRHSCCRYNHGALDALDQVLVATAITADQVDSISVATYGYAAELDDPLPRNVLGAKFSVPFAVATRIVTGSSGLTSFTWERVRDERIRALARRVQVREDKALTDKLPEFRPAQVEVRLKDGRVLAGATDVNRGDDSAPYSRAELDEKFFELGGRVWPLDVARSIHGDLHRLETLADLSTLSRSFDAIEPELRKAS